jgi:hypothetical protein
MKSQMKNPARRKSVQGYGWLSADYDSNERRIIYLSSADYP